MNTSNNYRYDEIGNLTGDEAEEILDIEWTVSGKIKSITRTPSSTLPDLEFRYDTQGNRISKIVKPVGTANNPEEWVETLYVRDATSNIMAIYERKAVSSSMEFRLKEKPIYGSSRIGVKTSNLDMTLTPSTIEFNRLLGLKQYEGVNHLGNVLTTFTDKKIPRSTNGTTIAYFMADVVSATDYYPFGMLMPGRSFSSEEYRFGFNTQENTDEISGIGNHTTAIFWEFDTRLGRRWNMDPKPVPSLSNFSCFTNNPILFNDILGDTTRLYNTKGEHLQTIPDNLTNQIHFIKNDKYDAVNKSFAQKDQNGKCYTNEDVAKEMRKNSEAFFSKKTFSDIERIRKQGEKNKINGSTYEQGFKLLVGSNNELRASEVFTDARSPGHFKMNNALELDKDFLSESIYAVGHTHVQNGKPPINALEFFGRPSPTKFNSKQDYSPILRKNNAEYAHPLIIASPYGITIHAPNINGYYQEYNSKTMVTPKSFFK